MSNLNCVFLVGNLGSDPELSYTANGKARARLSVATSHRRKTASGEFETDTTWHRVIVWDRQAETCHQHLRKGRQVLVEGRLRRYSYDDPEGSAKKRHMVEVVAHRVGFLGGGGGAHGRPANDDAQPPAFVREDQAGPVGSSDSAPDDLPF